MEATRSYKTIYTFLYITQAVLFGEGNENTESIWENLKYKEDTSNTVAKLTMTIPSIDELSEKNVLIISIEILSRLAR